MKTKNIEDKLFYRLTSQAELILVGNLYFILSSLIFILIINTTEFYLESLFVYIIGFLILGFTLPTLISFTKENTLSFMSYLKLLLKEKKKKLFFGLGMGFIFFIFSLYLSILKGTTTIVFIPLIFLFLSIGLGCLYSYLFMEKQFRIKESMIFGILIGILILGFFFFSKISFLFFPVIVCRILNHWKGVNQ